MGARLTHGVLVGADTSTVSACPGRSHTSIAREVGLRRVMPEYTDDVREHLTRGDPFREGHRGATTRTRPARRERCRGCAYGRADGRRREYLPTRRERLPSSAVREEAKQADPDKPFRQDVQKEATQEFDGADGHRARLTAMRVVFPAKRDLVVRHGDEAMIRDRDAVRVPRQVVQHVGRAAKGRFRIDDPVVTIQSTPPRAKGRQVIEARQSAGARQVSATKDVLQSRDEFSTEDPAEDLHGQEKPITPVDPSRAVRGETASGNHAVDMRMMLEILAPRVEHTQKPEPRAEMRRIRGDLQQRRRTRLKQQVVDDGFVLEREPRELVRQRKDDV